MPVRFLRFHLVAGVRWKCTVPAVAVTRNWFKHKLFDLTVNSLLITGGLRSWLTVQLFIFRSETDVVTVMMAVMNARMMKTQTIRISFTHNDNLSEIKFYISWSGSWAYLH